ncbi:MAG: hypothetical protein OEM89_02305 [Nitrosopumilus sp.]|nr:hypothetical protein [Nitrosopumilus sp.]
MKTKTFSLLAIPVIAAIMVVGAIAPMAMADPATVQGVAGRIILDHNDNLVPAECFEVIANNANQKGLFTCTGTATEPFPETAVILDSENNPRIPGLTCSTDTQGPTTNWQIVISTNGNLKLTCHFP